MARKSKQIIPLSRPFFDGSESREVKKVISSGWVTQGPRVKEFEDKFCKYVNSGYACAVSNCSAALHLALLAVGVKPGDAVITVSHSFIATANSIRHCGAEPVFVDVELDTFNMSVSCLEKILNEDCEAQDGQLYYKEKSQIISSESPLKYLNPTRLGRVAAIMPVHQMGMPSDLGAILPLAAKFNLPVVEDAACAIGSEIKIGPKWEKIGKPHGDIACFSFHPRKLITTGEGGMLTTNNPDYDKKVRLLRHQGMSMSDMVRHHSKKILFEKYLTTGYNYRLTDIQAAIGIVQLKKLSKLISERKKIAGFYQERLKNIPWLKLPQEPDYCRCNWQSYPVRVLEDAPLSHNELMQYLFKNGISIRPGIMNAHEEKIYMLNISLKNSELARDSVILLPIFNRIKRRQLEKIVKFIKNA